MGSMSGWPSGLRRCVQVAVHFCGRGFESHFWHKIFLGKINSFVGWLYPLKCPQHGSRVAQWKRAGPITQRSVDRNHALLKPVFHLWKDPWITEDAEAIHDAGITYDVRTTLMMISVPVCGHNCPSWPSKRFHNRELCVKKSKHFNWRNCCSSALPSAIAFLL